MVLKKKLYLHLKELKLRVLLQEKEEELFTKKWLPLLLRDWPIVEESVGRRYLDYSIDNLNLVHSVLSVLSPTAITEFLKLYGTVKRCSGTAPHITKGKLILYQLIDGSTNNDIPGVPYSTYRRIYEMFWRKSVKKINA